MSGERWYLADGQPDPANPREGTPESFDIVSCAACGAKYEWGSTLNGCHSSQCKPDGWTNIGGDLEAKYDGVKYVDLRNKHAPGQHYVFLSREGLQAALGLIPSTSNHCSKQYRFTSGHRAQCTRPVAHPGLHRSDMGEAWTDQQAAEAAPEPQ